MVVAETNMVAGTEVVVEETKAADRVAVVVEADAVV